MPKAPKTTIRKHLERVRRICIAIPGTVEKLSHGEPTFFAEGKRVFTMFAGNHHSDGRIAVWIPAAPGLQVALIQDAPRTYFRPPYVGASGWVGIDVERIGDDELASHILQAWKMVAPKKQQAAEPVDSFEPVRRIGSQFPEVRESTMYGKPALKIDGKMVACVASHRSAEPNSLVVRVDFEQRAELLAGDPDVYYITDRYRDYPSVLVRLQRVQPDALRDLLGMACRQIGRKAARGSARRKSP
jgi:hypothetical protein